MTEKSEFTHEILEYWVDHPDAQDTLNGIVQWWLLDRRIRYQREQVREALAELVRQELVVEVRSPDSQSRYRINQSKLKEIEAWIRSKTGYPDRR
jgi:Fe2+ or Zn2+ uptake regulation protein